MESDVIVDQPTSEKKTVFASDNVLPASLQQITETSQVTVSQHVDPVEVIPCCFARPSRYSLYVEGSENQLLYGQEISDCYARQIMGAARSFALKFSDDDLVDVLKVNRTQTCSRGCCGICCSLPVLEVQSPPGTILAAIHERRTCCTPRYDVLDPGGTTLFTLHPRACYPGVVALCCNIHIDIVNDQGDVMGMIEKDTSGNCKDCIGHTNNFTVKYSSTLSLEQKLILLGSSFLLDFHYFEKQNRFCC
ncbi:phospholipid scramblase 1-like [Mya arenaria]|uniref:phospholipid scramblase 1-like n=1 Tax=Mya arenaria TaxID=6604 RepID=UPI0022DF3EAB|nr:phospholipid scramblase 1-like [Mya arenaria]